MKELLKTSLNRLWKYTIHFQFPKKIRIQIETIIKLSKRKNTQLYRLPKDVLYYMCRFISLQPQFTFIDEELEKEKQKIIK